VERTNVGRTNVTDDRQTDDRRQTDGRAIAYSEHEREFTFANKTRMWANAQRDVRPAEYRGCPLFNAAKFG